LDERKRCTRRRKPWKLTLASVGACITLLATSSAGSSGTFQLIGKGQGLPSDEFCRAAVGTDTLEPRPSNSAFNHTTPSASFLAAYKSAIIADGGLGASLLERVDGQYTGTTDGVLKWASCKWGFDEDVTRATAVNESHWNQAGIGDVDNGISLGILQVKARDFPATCPAVAASQKTAKVVDPNCYSYRSTAFNADYKLAQQRVCFEGDVNYLTERVPAAGYPTYPHGTPDQMMWGCVGWWFSGGWFDAGSLTYIGQVQGYLKARPWLHDVFSLAS
jgi:hypothetical protein